MDTNTNVCPSEHVICALAVMVTAWHCQALRKPAWILFFTVTTIIICLSTVFLKQHSILDALAALPVCFIAYLFSFWNNNGKTKSNFHSLQQ
jgi:membrane-associated phospholipid phosphatase